MSTKLSFKFILIILLWLPLFASAGMRFEAAVSVPAVEMQMTDGAVANYSGLAMLGRVHIPIVESDRFVFTLNGSARYLSLNNNANSEVQREAGDHLGYGGGVQLKYAKIVLGADYLPSTANHIWLGDTYNEYREFDYSLVTSYIGIEWTALRSLNVGLHYSIGTADSELEGQTIKYTDEIIWLTIKFDSGSEISDFTSTLIRK